MQLSGGTHYVLAARKSPPTRPIQSYVAIATVLRTSALRGCARDIDIYIHLHKERLSSLLLFFYWTLLIRAFFGRDGHGHIPCATGVNGAADCVF